VAFAAQAQQTPPDAGTLLRQQPAPPAVVPLPVPRLAPEAPISKATPGPRFLLKGFRFTGAVLVPEAELQARVSIFLDQEVNFGVLQAIALDLTGYYLQKGYVARVVVPQQEIQDGIVEMKIIEGVRGSLSIDKQGQRVDVGRVAGFIDQRLSEGAAFDLSSLEEAVAILNEQPGVQLRTSLKPGSREGEVGVVVSAYDKPLRGGGVGINNHGARASGQAQAQGALTLSNPTGRFDAASLLVNASEGNAYARAEYSLAVGNRGLRIGANASYLDYSIVQSSLKALDLHGSARTYGIAASYPLVRGRALSMNLAASHDVKKLVDQSAAGETGDREVSATTLGVIGSLQHQLGSRSSASSIGATLHFGDSDEHNAGALAADSAARRTNGSFSKLSYAFANVSDLGGQWSTSIAFRGQFTGENLDSSERLSLGGPTAVRAYPIGEATGDEGWLINLNLRRSFGNTLATTLFYDAGRITLNNTTWANWNAGTPNLPNHYTLSGIGAGVDWRFVPAGLLSASIAVPVGRNPGRDANNHNADGHDNKARLWVSLNAQF
jgi:hemolysin activation/secretion protein